MSDDQIEAMIRDLVEINLDEDARAAAVEWLDKHTICYTAAVELGLIDRTERAAG